MDPPDLTAISVGQALTAFLWAVPVTFDCNRPLSRWGGISYSDTWPGLGMDTLTPLTSSLGLGEELMQ